MKAEDVIKPEFYEEYVKTRDAIQNHLVFLYTNFYVLKKIANFPWKLMPSPDNESFWYLTSKNYYDTIIIALCALIFDSQRPEGKESLSLNRFKNQLLANTVNELFKEEIRERLKTLKIEGISLEKNEDLIVIKEKIKDIRDNYLAHLDHANLTGINLSVNPIVYPLPISKIEIILDAILRIFEALALEKVSQRTFWGYPQNADFVEMDEYTDIDNLLGYVASQSYFLNKKLEYWHADEIKEEFEKLSPEDRATVEYWRERVEKMNGRN